MHELTQRKKIDSASYPCVLAVTSLAWLRPLRLLRSFLRSLRALGMSATALTARDIMQKFSRQCLRYVVVQSQHVWRQVGVAVDGHLLRRLPAAGRQAAKSVDFNLHCSGLSQSYTV